MIAHTGPFRLGRNAVVMPSLPFVLRGFTVRGGTDGGGGGGGGGDDDGRGGGSGSCSCSGSGSGSVVVVVW